MLYIVVGIEASKTSNPLTSLKGCSKSTTNSEGVG